MRIDKLKSFRLLNMYEKLNRGDIINKKQFARRVWHLTERLNLFQ